MNILSYLKKNGIKRAFDVIYQYKLHGILCKLIFPFVKNKPLKDTIVIESHNDFDCNGGILYDYLIENGYNQRYKIVWLLKNAPPRGKTLPSNVKTLYLRKPSIRKAYHFCTAKYFTADNSITQKMRPEQKYLFCDHGAVALKSVRGLYKIPDSVDYMLCPSPFYKPIIASEFSVPADDKRFVCVGYPMHDIFYRETGNELEKITKKKYSKVFLWMPTFRKGGGFRRNDSTAEQPFGLPLIESEQMLESLQQFLAETDSLLIIKIHPMQDPDTLKRLHGSDNICVLTGTSVKQLGIDNYRLVKHADALISDYSSIAFSYMLLNRPVGFVLSDLEDYKLGFAMENPEEFLTGTKIYTFEDFFAFLQEVHCGVDSHGEERRQLVDKLFVPRDGDSCKRIVEIMEIAK